MPRKQDVLWLNGPPPEDVDLEHRGAGDNRTYSYVVTNPRRTVPSLSPRRCAYLSCRQWFMPSRRDRRFCKDACQRKAYAARPARKQARKGYMKLLERRLRLARSVNYRRRPDLLREGYRPAGRRGRCSECGIWLEYWTRPRGKIREFCILENQKAIQAHFYPHKLEATADTRKGEKC